jgi:ferredoxin
MGHGVPYPGKGHAVAYKINDECVSCGSCQSECPVEAIKEGEGKYVIEAAKCTDCGNCAGVCPVECIIQA